MSSDYSGALAAGTARVASAPGDVDPDAPDIQDLVARSQQGDKTAFASLYRLHVQSVYRYLSYRLRNTSVAEDLTAEVFLRVLKKINTFEWRGIDFSAWVIRIARNVLLDHLKSSGTRLEVVGIAPGDMPENSVPGSDLEVMDTLDREALHEALNKLRPDHQEVLYLRFLQGLSSIEVAQAMGKTEGAIRVLQFRALKQLLRTMQPNLQEE